MIALLDTDILIDVATDRHPHVIDSSQILNAAESGEFQSFIAWHTLSNFYYIVSSQTNHELVMRLLRDLLQFIKVAETNTINAAYAIELNIRDFEDGMQIAAAHSCNAKYIVTRNIRHYKNSPIPAIHPAEFISLLK